MTLPGDTKKCENLKFLFRCHVVLECLAAFLYKAYIVQIMHCVTPDQEL